ncbi:uncharacterized protein LOC112495405 [Cephus cinctus]|uniref:Uncharacterized protein LOC112495405 n=1 Tax=Cephus cinctus TaxID=211228 RepID=A0AAJ7RVU9_CEPCN|nr:uncharacterized protein LOC112495405 [Cephus cinctus]
MHGGCMSTAVEPLPPLTTVLPPLRKLPPPLPLSALTHQKICLFHWHYASTGLADESKIEWTSILHQCPENPKRCCNVLGSDGWRPLAFTGVSQGCRIKSSLIC